MKGLKWCFELEEYAFRKKAADHLAKAMGVMSFQLMNKDNLQ